MGLAHWVAWAMMAAAAHAQQARVCVVDAAGQPLTSATVVVQSAPPMALDANACATVPIGARATFALKSFAPVTITA
ncbi:MAG TPA: hypothetical protein VGM11_03220, partial [Acidobacteriaceae bacterium]